MVFAYDRNTLAVAGGGAALAGVPFVLAPVVLIDKAVTARGLNTVG